MKAPEVGSCTIVYPSGTVMHRTVTSIKENIRLRKLCDALNARMGGAHHRNVTHFFT